ncbi:HNH endonuclease [Pontibacillus salipaludis]|uniref:HNH endonuclease n=1 Tax=Pontibacillus salipaludis TaxID=1697394 RepID=UPI0031E5B85A
MKTTFNLLTKEHQVALNWFEMNSGKEDVPYTPKYNNIPLVSPAEGIFKPKSSNHVLSVKETLKGEYPDQEPIYLPNGSWLYAYHQRGDNSKYDRDNYKSNAALLNNIRDQIPVGVLMQTKSKGRGGARYRIELALPIGWVDGFFILTGANSEGDYADIIESPAITLSYILKENENRKMDNPQTFDVSNVVDERKKIFRSIVQRQGQTTFRKGILSAYNGECVITNTNVEEALEAAHITPYMGTYTNSRRNGILLRSDVHTLWDLGFICIDPNSKCVIVHPTLHDSEYGAYHGKEIKLPSDPYSHPSLEALEQHKDFCGI